MSMEKAIIKLFGDRPNKIFTVQQIYNDFENYYKLTAFQKELDPKYSYATRYQHAIRSILAKLEKQDIIEKLDRNMRRLKKVGG